MSVRLGDLLIKQGLLTTDQLQEGLRYQRHHGGRLGSILIQLGHVSDDSIATVLSQQYDLPSVNLTEASIDSDVIRLIPIETAIRYQVLPLKRVGTTLTIAIADPTNVLALDEIKFMTGYQVEPVVAAEGAIRKAIEEYYGTEQTLELQRVYDELAAEVGEFELDMTREDDLDLAELQTGNTEAPIIKLVNITLAESIRRGASDIHLEPYEKEFRIRFRIDGVLYHVMSPPIRLKDAIISRLKIMANLDISERRLPQDGRIKIRINYSGRQKEIDFRVSSLPTLFGEKVVLRILDREKLPRSLSELGFEPESYKAFERAIARPYGMVLVTGPTGSGKTSTLYTCLNRLNTEQVNIMTAEDPVEFNFRGINQVQTNEHIGLTFANALRSFLRQDPNIVMVGEIRDLETAEIAVKAALTGHLVLSTLHTNDAPSTVSRLLNMGIEPFLVANSVNLICAQRLVRVICKECKQQVETPVQALIDIGFPPSLAKNVRIYQGTGCQRCNDSGYKGRVGL
ncbi:MAG TPA: type IV-A pilus assembly ATPase PilB, partial [Acidobacteriota bacterium]|nr:type IV-A pilus assembly ATPase PilB [Acidobacteriota bacterium]